MNYIKVHELKTTEIKNVKHLLTVLKSNQSEIENIIANKQKYYYITNKIKEDKRGNPILDENGKIQYRILNPSTGRLKELQYLIKARILSKIPLPLNVKGGTRGWNNIANAAIHLGKI